MSEARDEAGWLIERGDSQACEPSYWGWVADEEASGLDWTKSHQDALRFARKIDAERYALDAGWNNVRICEHEWPGQRKKSPADFLAERAGKVLEHVPRLNKDQIWALLGDERAIEHLHFRDRDELIAQGLARRMKPTDERPYWRTWVTISGLMARAMLGEEDAFSPTLTAPGEGK